MLSGVVIWSMGCTSKTLIVHVALFIACAASVQHYDSDESGLEA